MKKVIIKMSMVVGVVTVGFFGGQMKAEAFENGATLNVDSNVSNEAHLDGNLLDSGSSVGLGLNLKGSIDLSSEEENEIKSSHSEHTSGSMNKTVESDSEISTKSEVETESELDTNSELNSNSSGQISSSDLNSESSGSTNLDLDVKANSKTDLSLVQKTKLWFLGLIHSIFGESNTEVGTSTQVEMESSIQSENEAFSSKVNQQGKTENSLGLQSMFSLLFR